MTASAATNDNSLNIECKSHLYDVLRFLLEAKTVLLVFILIPMQRREKDFDLRA